jgi:hypothetical protein
MNPSKRFLALAGLLGLALVGLHANPAPSDDQPPPKPRPGLDRGKSFVIEPGIANVVKAAAPAPAPVVPPAVPVVQPKLPRLDIGKSAVIEPSTQQLLQAAAIQQMRAAAKAEAAAKSDFVNPKVEPGKVRWHKSIEEAQAAAVKSKKPVLIFQMMGKLDDQFC